MLLCFATLLCYVAWVIGFESGSKKIGSSQKYEVKKLAQYQWDIRYFKMRNLVSWKSWLIARHGCVGSSQFCITITMKQYDAVIVFQTTNLKIARPKFYLLCYTNSPVLLKAYSPRYLFCISFLNCWLRRRYPVCLDLIYETLFYRPNYSFNTKYGNVLQKTRQPSQ